MTFRQHVGLIACRVIVWLGWPRRHVQNAKVVLALKSVLTATDDWIRAVEQENRRNA